MSDPTRTRVFCTYFDSAYAARGALMIDSLRIQGESGEVFVLALDDQVARMLGDSGLSGVTIVTPPELENAYPELAATRADRSAMEHVFTLTPWLVRFVREQSPTTWVVYLDADIGFFSSCEPVFAAMDGGSVAIVPHRFTPEQSWRLKYGTYNVAWVGFRDDTDGGECLRWWAERCREWCRDEVEPGRFADQGYLDHFASVVDSVVVIDNPGVDLAPWNLAGHRLEMVGDRVRVDGQPLVFFHFHGLRRHGRRYYFKHLPYRARTSRTTRDGIYLPYCTSLDAWDARLGPARGHGTVLGRRHDRLRFLRKGRDVLFRLACRARGDTLVVPAVVEPLATHPSHRKTAS